MANWRRGEIEASLGGQRYTLCLTLGALCELEELSGKKDLMALLSSFEEGTFRSEDLLNILTSAVRGGGATALSREEIAALPFDGAIPGMLSLVTRLLEATFQTSQPNAPSPVSHKKKASSPGPRSAIWAWVCLAFRLPFFGKQPSKSSS